MKGNKGERRENEWEISVRVTEHKRHLTLGKEQGVVEREVGGGLSDWVTGTEGGTWQDEHWVLCYMLANRTPIKKKMKGCTIMHAYFQYEAVILSLICMFTF